jgi:hypothetical protein
VASLEVLVSAVEMELNTGTKGFRKLATEVSKTIARITSNPPCSAVPHQGAVPVRVDAL